MRVAGRTTVIAAKDLSRTKQGGAGMVAFAWRSLARVTRMSDMAPSPLSAEVCPLTHSYHGKVISMHPNNLNKRVRASERRSSDDDGAHFACCCVFDAKKSCRCARVCVRAAGSLISVASRRA